MATPFPDVPEHRLDELRRAEAIIVWLRWLAMASWPFILAAAPRPVAPAAVWSVYALGVAYTATTHVLNRGGRAIRATAFATTVADPVLTAIACAVTGGLASPIYPFFYLTTLATSIRLGMRETLATVGLTAALSAALDLWAPRAPHAAPADLALTIFYLFFVALEGGLLSRAARAQSQRRQEVLWRLIHAEEEERRRVAGEIHDRLGGRFFTAHHTLERVRTAAGTRDPETERALVPVADAMRACADELRAITNALRPMVLDDFGFVEALREHVAGLAGGDGTPRVTLAVDAPEPRTPAVRVMLFRVLQEALLNALKHAGATDVRVAFATAADALVLTIRDDGRGFDPRAVPRGHLGLVYMRERAEACGGRLEVRSRPGSGTEIRVSVPLERM